MSIHFSTLILAIQMGELASNFFITLKFFPIIYRNEEEPVCTLKQAIRHTCGSCPTSECAIEVTRGFVVLDSVKRSKFNSNCLLSMSYLQGHFSVTLLLLAI